MEPTNQSLSYDLYYVEENNKTVEVYHVDEMESEQNEKTPRYPITFNELPPIADL